MIFYEDFLKRLEEAKFDIEDKEAFSVEAKKLVSTIGVGIALLAIGIFQIYMLYMKQGNIGKGIFGVALIYIALRQVKVLYAYRMNIDSVNRVLSSKKITIDLNNVESCTLKEAKIGKKIETVIDIITNDNKEIVIPFYMGKKVKFAYVLKTLLGDRFIIKK